MTPRDLAGELRTLTLDALHHSVVVADARSGRDRPLVFANDAFLRLTGYARDEVLGRDCRFLQGPGTDPLSVEALRTALRDDQPYVGELLNYRRDGTPFWNALSIVPLHDEDGVTAFLVATQLDVTPLRERTLRDEQRGRVALLDAFARGVAHDVNNVLLAASGYAELLAAKLTGAEHDALRRYAEQIVSSCAGGRRLTHRLLGLGRDSEGAADVLDAAAVVAATVARSRAFLGADVRVRTELPAAAANVAAERSQLEQILLNLLANARDRAGARAVLTVTVAETEASVEVTVRGPGLPDEEGEDAFFTVHGGERSFGLQTTAALVRRLGGTLLTRPAPGSETVSVVSLPRVD